MLDCGALDGAEFERVAQIESDHYATYDLCVAKYARKVARVERAMTRAAEIIFRRTHGSRQ
jgi:hypothetical protein